MRDFTLGLIAAIAAVALGHGQTRGASTRIVHLTLNWIDSTRPEPWTPARFTAQGRYAPFALHPDGARILMAPPSSGAGAQKLVILTNFGAELNAKVKRGS